MNQATHTSGDVELSVFQQTRLDALDEIAADIGIGMDAFLRPDVLADYAEIYPAVGFIVDHLGRSQVDDDVLALELHKLKPWTTKAPLTDDVEGDWDEDDWDEDDWDDDDWDDGELEGEEACEQTLDGESYDDSIIEETIIEQCRGESVFGSFADYAPPHAVLELIAEKMQGHGLNIADPDAQEILLEVAQELVSPGDWILENNPYLACFYCENEIEPVVDEAFVQTYLDWKNGKIALQEFYRCPDCGGPITARRKSDRPERHLPWFHYAHGYDFDLGDDEKPQR